MRICALDIGEKRCGVALSDASATVAFPKFVVPTAELLDKRAQFGRLVFEEEPELIVVGLPYTRAGEEGDQAGFSRKIAEQVSRTYDVKITYVDERLSSKTAKDIMHELGFSEREMRGKLDAYAASVVLESYLDSLSAHKEKSNG